MALSTRELAQLQKIIEIAQSLIAKAGSVEAGKAEGPKRKRRSGKELVAFRKMLIALRKKGTPVADLAKQNGVSPAYIYQL